MDEQAVAQCLENLPDNIQAFEQIAHTLDKITSSEELKLNCIHDYHSSIHNENTFADLLYAYYSDGDYRDTILMFDMAAQKGENFYEGRQLESGIIELSRSGIGGCVTTLDYQTTDWWQNDAMHLVNDLRSLTLAARKLFRKLAQPTEKLIKLSGIMFPNIYFHADIHNFKRMGVSYRDHIRDIIDHLAYLNDHASSDFENDLPSHIIGLASSKGIELSPESPNTHANTQAMSKRDIEINGVILTCEWHSKITYNKGRIHFHARPSTHHERILKLSEAKVIIGIIAEHLPT